MQILLKREVHKIYYRIVTSHRFGGCEESHYVKATDPIIASNKIRSKTKKLVLSVEPIEQDEFYRGLVDEGLNNADAIRHLSKSLKGAV
jgi:hypothetical protein